jgi:hypothetical protein
MLLVIDLAWHYLVCQRNGGGCCPDLLGDGAERVNYEILAF